MSKQRLRNWVLNNPFYQYQGQFSKSAFIAMNTWVLVVLRYVFNGMTFSAGTVERTVFGRVIPALKWSWTIGFDGSEAVALLTVVFGLYFGGKFSPNAKAGAVANMIAQNPQGEEK